MSNAAVKAMIFASSLPEDECKLFCDMWVHGDFEEIAKEFPECPKEALDVSP